jgi:8-oxo-dGTP pyrophosphatase MutT (NUDIX family)
VRFENAATRLSELPDPLPPPAAAMMPVVIGRSDAPERRRPVRDGSGRPAAVLVLLYPDDVGNARIVLIERTTGDGHHSGEVSFPGGKAEPDDTDLAATALREANEEVALDADAAGIRIVGRLDQMWIPVSDFDVTPVVALAERRPHMSASPFEVASILEPPVDRFLPGAPITMVERTIREWPLRYGSYDVDGLSVWGATARILSQLGAVLASETVPTSSSANPARG